MYKITRSIFIVTVWIGCSIPLTSLADRVQGTVNPKDVGTFEVLDKEGKTIKTVNVNNNGEFTVYLHPGRYKVSSKSGIATIRSEAMPMRNQRIIFEEEK